MTEENVVMEKGKLSIETENILPIIKKWLYSEKEIFIRELCSNAFDALTKVRKVGLSEDVYQAEDEDYHINLNIDSENGTLTIEDNGIGMDADEIKKYITQIAFSGAEEFIKKYEAAQEGDQGGIIGHFGLGFYSSFMVANRVEIRSRSFRPDAKAVHWASDGGTEYEIGEGDREKRGTAITLHLAEDEKELLDKGKLSELVRKYCDFIPVPINVDGAEVNKKIPLWSKMPSSLKKEDYHEFYRYLFPYQGDPLFYVHLNVDHPFKLQGILYFPRLAHELDLNRSNVKIYCRQIFVSDEAQELIPKFLTVLQGVIDLPDLPLNVSRSYLQNEPQIQKIANHIVKKVADRLQQEFKNNREEFGAIWPDIAPFVKFGALNDERFFDLVKESILYQIAGTGSAEESTPSPLDLGAEGDDAKDEKKEEENKAEFVTLEEYVVNNKTKTDGKIFYSSDPVTQAGPLKLLRSQDIQVLLLNTMIDSHFIQFMETKGEDYKFARIDAELADTILDKDGESKLVDADNKDLTSHLTDLFKKALSNDKVTIRVESLKTEEVPAMILLPEQMRRFSEMTAHMSQKPAMFPEEHTLLLNSKNDIIQRLARPGLVAAEGASSKNEIVARQVYALARLAQGNLGPNETERFVSETYELLDKVM